MIPGKLSLVLPAFNEEANLGPVIEQAITVLPRFAADFEIIVVNDGSRDATRAIAMAFAARDVRIRVVNHARNRGYGAALTSGFEACTGATIMFMDADRQFDIADLRLLAPFVHDFDMVAGFRLERNDPLHRRFYAEIFNITIRVLFGVHLRDIDCAFKIFRGDLLRGMQLAAPGALINTEIQAKARRQGATLQQVGVHHYPRLAENRAAVIHGSSCGRCARRSCCGGGCTDITRRQPPVLRRPTCLVTWSWVEFWPASVSC